MKKRLSLLVLALMMTLTACSGKYPDRAADGTAWDRDWTILGTVLGVEDPGGGFELTENPVVLTGEDTHYAVWSLGEGEIVTNAAGKEATVYNAQLYFLLCGCRDGDYAMQTVEAWMERQRAVYDITVTDEAACNSQTYTLLHYNTRSEDNPYARGVLAFAVAGRYAVSAELTCRQNWVGDEAAVLTQFLNGCHWAANLEG